MARGRCWKCAGQKELPRRAEAARPAQPAVALPAGCFDHVVCVAVLNSFPELGCPIRRGQPHPETGGIFAFTVEEQKVGQNAAYPINPVEVGRKVPRGRGGAAHRHSAALTGERARARWIHPAQRAGIPGICLSRRGTGRIL